MQQVDTSLPATIFRSPALQPSAQGLLRNPEGVWQDWKPDGAAQFERFREARRQLCTPLNGEAAEDLEAWVQKELHRPHALMLMLPEGTLSDGAAWAVSSGYLDGYNLPPSDTWVTVLSARPERAGYADDWLVAWVPEWAEHLIAHGIRINPEECIGWGVLQNGELEWEL